MLLDIGRYWRIKILVDHGGYWWTYVGSGGEAFCLFAERFVRVGYWAGGW